MLMQKTLRKSKIISYYMIQLMSFLLRLKKLSKIIYNAPRYNCFLIWPPFNNNNKVQTKRQPNEESIRYCSITFESFLSLNAQAMSQSTIANYFTPSSCFFCFSIQYFTNALIIGHTRYHTFKLAAASIQSLVVSWALPFLQ